MKGVQFSFSPLEIVICKYIDSKNLNCINMTRIKKNYTPVQLANVNKVDVC